MISVEAALEIILNEIKPLGMERINILSALGRILCEDITAPIDNPPWDNSAMDGYAVKTADTKRASKEKPVLLKVIEDLPAGYTAKKTIKTGEAIRIMTGAPIPKGADAVVMVEDTEKTGGRGLPPQALSGGQGSGVRIFREAKTGDNIRKAGEDFKKGDIVLKKGMNIRPAETGMLAAVGKPNVYVYQKPNVAVLSTGDELVEIEEIPKTGKIINSNSYTLAAQIKECGAIPIQLCIARDTKKDLKEKLYYGLSADCIVSSGGVSVGDFDFVKDVLKELGSDPRLKHAGTGMRFWKVAMKPGKPLAFGVIGGKPAFGLPGNPISSMVAFEQFVRPTLMKMAGKTALFRQTFKAALTRDIKIKPGRVNFIRAELKPSESGFTVTPLDGQGSGMILTMVRANCFVIVPQDSTGFKEGDIVRVQPFDDTVFTGTG